MKKDVTVSRSRNYAVLDVAAARDIAFTWLERCALQNAVAFGLPEIDDRYHIWRVPLLTKGNATQIGEIVIDAYTSIVQEKRTTRPALLEQRLLGRDVLPSTNGTATKIVHTTRVRNTIALGDSEEILQELPSGCIDLIFTSPPYYNVRPEYSDFVSYQEYLLKLRKIIQLCHHVLSEGRFFVINISPVLVRRANRNASSKRIAVPFDVHRIFVEEGYDFIDDIIWEKPEGAGWATSRGRRFAADRNPLQYKPVPVTEYILVYRKHTEKLIDWNIRNHPDQEAIQASKIDDDYQRTNIWRIKPAYSKEHPAIFPVELAQKVIQYYSFKRDVVLDPFAGIGTVGEAAVKLGRKFVLIEQNPDYVEIIRRNVLTWLGKEAKDVLTLHCPPIDTSSTLF